ncbi:bifunctional diguanylate cyclase/phosphodiesterase [Lacisediminimonas sp.]|uniref:putative bifunctional diguanylate cyclase/phosphodiesterase n=1 Tax=Lacisediminimonas sp. TaxID=3060582 RepID=UPI002720B459|nr:EAL domain-containing protein [Lacisediminimonas sp.]MDO8299659.1 EAL domain-containing protein [Lacisediminimonas sp.]
MNERIVTRHERLLLWASTWLLPILIGLLSLWALVAWDAYYASSGSTMLPVRVVSADNLTPGEARKLLESEAPSANFNTKLSERPFWFSFANHDGAEPAVFEFTSRHARTITCWDGDNLAKLGEAVEFGTAGAVVKGKAGFALYSEAGASHFLCRASFVGPARQSVLQWSQPDFVQSSQEFHRNAGLLDGGILLLAAFVLVTAIVLKKGSYVLFAAWLIVNLRMGALSAGWDMQWLGRAIPSEWLPQMRLLTVALYYMLTVTLFSSLFRDDLEQVGYRPLLRFAQLTCIPLLALSVILPYPDFLPLIWISTGLSSTVLVFFLVRILKFRPSPVAWWYSASIGVALFASLYEVLSAALGLKGLLMALNSVTAALASSLLAALAIAEQVRQEQRRREEMQAELAHTYEAIPIGLFTLDLNGNFVSVNPAILDMLGERTNAGSNWRQHFGPAGWIALHDMVHQKKDGELDLDGPTGEAGELRRFHVKATLARGKIEGSLQDITQQERANAELRFIASNDRLTKVLNRHGIEKALEQAIAESSDRHPVALAYLDLDRFKLINDLYGHTAGDEVLRQVTARVNSMLSGNHHIGRVGADQFVIVLPDTSISLATWICRGIVERLGSEPYQIGDKAFQVRGSIGLLELEREAEIRDALSTADRACHEAKSGNHSGLVVLEKNASALHERQVERKLVERLSTGMAPEGLFLEMQPIMSLKAPLDSLNFEVLLRMRDPDGSVIPASRVINAAEHSGRTGVVDRWVLQTLLDWLTENGSRLPNTQFVCMNLSGASLNDERFAQDAAAMLQRHPAVASRLCIEITESVALRDLENTRRFIDKVRGQGARVALDDFGAGYTSFSYLKDLPADVLKIDGSFIVNMNRHPANVAIVEAIVSLAMNLGMKTIAEWAEDHATVRTLVDIGVDYVQGFAIARSQSPEALLAASSAASFIADPRLAEYVRTISSVGDAPGAPIDMMKYRELH